MKGFPQLTTQDVEQLDGLLKDFLARSGVQAALIVERAGYLILRVGNELSGDDRDFANLASNAFNAAQEMSRRLKENFFPHLRVSGAEYQTFIRHVDDSCLLVVVFDSRISTERVDGEAVPTVIGIAERLEIARQRAPGAVVDFADADAENVTKFFRRTPPPA